MHVVSGQGQLETPVKVLYEIVFSRSSHIELLQGLLGDVGEE